MHKVLPRYTIKGKENQRTQWKLTKYFYHTWDCWKRSWGCQTAYENWSSYTLWNRHGGLGATLAQRAQVRKKTKEHWRAYKIWELQKWRKESNLCYRWSEGRLGCSKVWYLMEEEIWYGQKWSRGERQQCSGVCHYTAAQENSHILR